ncbi:Uu.00g045020.m01.CDS01 [Anthostomella pinea]|uniref:Uu.00g045020.m01.CDS01 n=1 Tax=Anthostomella pinea TaxID=933095 RepID=A0AAI8VB18_9PEZI|nr:Uu.00g045020.m01.CDS01 [Anthostomella pinea]
MEACGVLCQAGAKCATAFQLRLNPYLLNVIERIGFISQQSKSSERYSRLFDRSSALRFLLQSSVIRVIPPSLGRPPTQAQLQEQSFSLRYIPAAYAMGQDQYYATDLATTYRDLYRAKFRADVQADISTPFLVPLHFLGVWIVPTLYLAIPHKNRPWLYRARWLVLAFIVAFHAHMLRDVASLNFASAYGTGLLAVWATLWNFTLLIWTRPQWDAKRVDVRRKKGYQRNASQPPEANGHAPGTRLEEQPRTAETSARETNGHAGSATKGDAVQELRQRQAKYESGTASSPKGAAGVPEESKGVSDAIAFVLEREDNASSDQEPALDIDKMAAEQEYEYYWQEYPADAPFRTRLDWSFDIVSTMRMTGWNWAPRCLPPFRLPPSIGSYQLPLDFGPHESRQGFTRTLSRRKLFLQRFFLNIVPSYIIVDFCAALMTADPYFILGPEHGVPLPPHLTAMHPLTLSLRRTALSFVGVFTALQLAWNLGALALAFLCRPVLGFRAHPWHLPTFGGSFTQVLDRGLQGFWGAWWHQTFRFGFAAPTNWLLAHGYIRKGTPASTLVGAVLAFVQSAMLHGAGSYSTIPQTRWWLPPVFFALSGVGTVLQSSLARSAILKPRIAALPRWVRRAGNLLFVAAWLWATSWALVDDFGRCGLWMYEPVPVSLARWLGFGGPADGRVWRYDGDFWPRWYVGARWWERGVAI